MHRETASDTTTFNVGGGMQTNLHNRCPDASRRTSPVDFRGPGAHSSSQHTTPIVSINIVQGTSGSAAAGSSEKSHRHFEQLLVSNLATLEESGVVMLWTLLSLRRGDQAGSEKILVLASVASKTGPFCSNRPA